MCDRYQPGLWKVPVTRTRPDGFLRTRGRIRDRRATASAIPKADASRRYVAAKRSLLLIITEVAVVFVSVLRVKTSGPIQLRRSRLLNRPQMRGRHLPNAAPKSCSPGSA